MPQNRSLLGRDLKNVVSSSPPKKASDKSNITTLELLCFCRVYVVELTISARVVMPSGGKASLKAREDIVGVAMEEQSGCSYLEKILTEKMGPMGKETSGLC